MGRPNYEEASCQRVTKKADPKARYSWDQHCSGEMRRLYIRQGAKWLPYGRICTRCYQTTIDELAAPYMPTNVTKKTEKLKPKTADLLAQAQGPAQT